MKYIFVAVLSLFLTSVVFAQQKPGPTPAPQKAEEKNVDKTKPSEEWLKRYDSFVALQSVVAQIRQENGLDKLEARLQNEASWLQAQLPPGYTFNPQQRSFVELPKPQPPAKEEKK